MTIETIETEVVIEGSKGQSGAGELNLEARKEQLREVVRELLREEFERFLRTEARR